MCLISNVQVLGLFLFTLRIIELFANCHQRLYLRNSLFNFPLIFNSNMNNEYCANAMYKKNNLFCN